MVTHDSSSIIFLFFFFGWCESSCVDRKSSDLGLAGMHREYLQTDCAINPVISSLSLSHTHSFTLFLSLSCPLDLFVCVLNMDIATLHITAIYKLYGRSRSI